MGFKEYRHDYEKRDKYTKGNIDYINSYMPFSWMDISTGGNNIKNQQQLVTKRRDFISIFVRIWNLYVL